jgi:hypothetical protein
MPDTVSLAWSKWMNPFSVQRAVGKDEGVKGKAPFCALYLCIEIGKGKRSQDLLICR